MKIKKNSVETKQIPWFHISDKKEIKEMINNGHDFSEKNIYGRTFFHYIKDVNLLEEMLNENKTHQWINLLDFDNFESHLLTSQQTVKAFNIVLKAFNEDYPELSEKIIFIKNNFNITPFNHINFLFKDDLRIEIESSLKDFADYLNLLQPNHQDIVSDYIEEFYKNPKFKALSKDKQNETKAQLLNFLLVKPAENNQNTKAFKI